MSHELIFNILPFNPFVRAASEVHLLIDPENLRHQLQTQYSNADVEVYMSEEGEVVRLYTQTITQGRWDIAGFIDKHNLFYVNGWPKSLAKEIILWYRRYIPVEHRLFLVTPENDYAAELTATTTSEDIDKLYPYMVGDDD